MGRKSGSKNATAFVYQHPSRCVNLTCGSTDRTGYSNRREEECVTTLGDGMPVTHVVRQNTSCKTCGQNRVDTTYHYIPGGGKVDQKSEKNPSIASEIRDELIESLNPPAEATLAV